MQLLIHKQTTESNTLLARHTFPYTLSIVARDLLLMRYMYSIPMLPSLVALFHHTESLEFLVEHLELLALHTEIQLHWKPSFVTLSGQPPFPSMTLHSVCHVQGTKTVGDSSKKGVLVVHLEGRNIYCVTANPVHTVPLSTPEELEQFILNYLSL